MPKPEAFTPKAIANRMKAKGLQKLRWYCQMCQKQCRDQNGFKCHCASESHQRQMALFAENPEKYMETFSREFLDEFVGILSRRYGTKRVLANQVYQEIVADRQHLHMNATKWDTLTEFVKYLGRNGICHVDETPRGWFVEWIDNSPAAMARREAVQKKERQAMDDEEREKRLLEEQMQRAKQQRAAGSAKPTEYTGLKRESEAETIKLKLEPAKSKPGLANIFKKKGARTMLEKPKMADPFASLKKKAKEQQTAVISPESESSSATADASNKGDVIGLRPATEMVGHAPLTTIRGGGSGSIHPGARNHLDTQMEGGGIEELSRCRSTVMSFAGFIFGNVDEEGKLETGGLDPELCDSLANIDEEGSRFLANVLGKDMFDEESKSESVDEEGGDEGEGEGSPARRVVQGSLVRPMANAVDYSNWDELAEESVATSTPMPPPRFNHSISTMFSQVSVDEDYDIDEEEVPTQLDVAERSSPGLELAVDHKIEPAMGESNDELNTLFSKSSGDEAGSDEEMLEDLFHSPIKETAEAPAQEAEAETKMEEERTPVEPPLKTPELSLKRPAEERPALKPQQISFDPSKPLKFTELFRCYLKPKTKRPRRVEFEELKEFIPAVDTRKIFEQPIFTPTNKPSFLQRVLQDSDESKAENNYVVLDEHGNEIPTRRSTRHAPTLDDLVGDDRFKALDLDPWEERIVWDDVDTITNRPTDQLAVSNGMSRVPNAELESDDWLESIIWDTSMPFKPFSKLQINMNDPHILFEDGEEVKVRNALEAERNRIMEGVDRFNLSNDHFYEALKEGKVQRVRQTFGQLIVAHSLPAVKTQAPLFKMRLSRADLERWHRPRANIQPGTVIRFSKVRSAKRRKKNKEGPESLWAAKDITIRDSCCFTLFEFSEENPPTMSNIGMGSVL
ncbi:hypothetical protein EV182_002175, partial [Spiromyces aspiralis]